MGTFDWATFKGDDVDINKKVEEENNNQYKETELSEAEKAWRDLRGRRKTVRFSQEFLIDLVKIYGDLPKGATVRDVHVDFDTLDIKYSVLHPDWPQVKEGERSETIDVKFDLPSFKDIV